MSVALAAVAACSSTRPDKPRAPASPPVVAVVFTCTAVCTINTCLQSLLVSQSYGRRVHSHTALKKDTFGFCVDCSAFTTKKAGFIFRIPLSDCVKGVHVELLLCEHFSCLRLCVSALRMAHIQQQHRQYVDDVWNSRAHLQLQYLPKNYFYGTYCFAAAFFVDLRAGPALSVMLLNVNTAACARTIRLSLFLSWFGWRSGKCSDRHRHRIQFQNTVPMTVSSKRVRACIEDHTKQSSFKSTTLLLSTEYFTYLVCSFTEEARCIFLHRRSKMHMYGCMCVPKSPSIAPTPPLLILLYYYISCIKSLVSKK